MTNILEYQLNSYPPFPSKQNANFAIFNISIINALKLCHYSQEDKLQFLVFLTSDDENEETMTCNQ